MHFPAVIGNTQRKYRPLQYNLVAVTSVRHHVTTITNHRRFRNRSNAIFNLHNNNGKLKVSIGQFSVIGAQRHSQHSNRQRLVTRYTDRVAYLHTTRHTFNGAHQALHHNIHPYKSHLLHQRVTTSSILVLIIYSLIVNNNVRVNLLTQTLPLFNFDPTYSPKRKTYHRHQRRSDNTGRYTSTFHSGEGQTREENAYLRRSLSWCLAIAVKPYTQGGFV